MHATIREFATDQNRCEDARIIPVLTARARRVMPLARPACGTSRADSAVGTAGESDRNEVTRGDKSFVRDMAIVDAARLLKIAVDERSNATN
jgi:hypothetical protein